MPVKTLKEPKKGNVAEICEAIAYAETGSCTTGSALTHNNCHGIRKCSGGRCYGFRTYESKEDSFIACEELWERGYGSRIPTWGDAEAYSGKDRTDNWYRLVHQYLNNAS